MENQTFKTGSQKLTRPKGTLSQSEAAERMAKSQSIVERQYLLPFVLVTSMFMLWGLANNMTDTLLAAFRKIMQMSGTYTALGIVLLAIMVIMLFANMPEGKDSVDLKVNSLEAAESGKIGATFRRLLRNRKYAWGVVAQFFYVGAQIGAWSFTIRLVMKELGHVEAEAATIYLTSIIGFCMSRFIYTWLMKYIAPGQLLAAGAMLSSFSTLVVVLSSGWTAVVALVLVSIFMSLMFPTIYGIALGDVENPAKGGNEGDAKIGASGLIMAILGGALLTPLQGMVSDAAGINMSYMVPLGCFIVVLLYALSCCKAEE